MVLLCSHHGEDFRDSEVEHPSLVAQRTYVVWRHSRVLVALQDAPADAHGPSGLD